MNKEMIITYIVIIIFLYLFSAIFSMLDMAYSTVRISRLETSVSNKERFSKDALKNATNYDRTIATILFGNDFVNIFSASLFSIVGTELLKEYIPNPELLDLTLTFIQLFILLIFCEYLPKAIGRNFSFSISKVFTYFITSLTYVFYIVVMPVTLFCTKLTSKLVEKTGKEEEVCSDDELLNMVDEIENEGIIDKDKSNLIQKSIQFKETSAYLIMTPRVKIIGYDIDTPLEKFISQVNFSTYSRIIVYKKDLDHIIGYFHVKRLLRELTLNNKFNINDLIAPLLSIPRTMLISSVLKTMKKKHQHILLVKDEYGGTDGIITMEDILEELVGEMWDENDLPTDSITSTSEDNTYKVRGDINIYEFFNFFNLETDNLDDDYATLSGYLINQLGRFARLDDTFTIDDIIIDNITLKNSMIDSTLVHINKKEDEEDEDYLSRLKEYKEKLEDIISNNQETK